MYPKVTSSGPLGPSRALKAQAKSPSIAPIRSLCIVKRNSSRGRQGRHQGQRFMRPSTSSPTSTLLRAAAPKSEAPNPARLRYSSPIDWRPPHRGARGTPVNEAAMPVRDWPSTGEAAPPEPATTPLQLEPQPEGPRSRSTPPHQSCPDRSRHPGVQKGARPEPRRP